jgi:hypothetical protein
LASAVVRMVVAVGHGSDDVAFADGAGSPTADEPGGAVKSKSVSNKLGQKH